MRCVRSSSTHTAWSSSTCSALSMSESCADRRLVDRAERHRLCRLGPKALARPLAGDHTSWRSDQQSRRRLGAMSACTDIEVLSESECLALLRSVEVGRLAVAIKNVPDIFPINFVMDGDQVVFRTAEGTKLAAALLGLGVAFEVDGYDADVGVAWSVVVKGYAIEIEQMYELFAAADLPLFPWHAGSKHRFVRIRPSEVTGRRFVVDRTARKFA